MSDKNNTTEPQQEDVQVVYTALAVAVGLAEHLRLGVKEVKRLAELSYFHHARRRGLKLREIAELMGVSAPKVGLLSKQFKAHFAAAEVAHGLHRRVLTLLWARTQTRQWLLRALEDFAPDDVHAALDALIAQGKVVEVPGRTPRYQVAEGKHRMVNDAWLARLDGLQDMMSAVGLTIQRRIFDRDARAFARSVRVDVLPEDIERLQKFYKEDLFPLLSELNERAGLSEDAVTMRVSVMWAPQDGAKDADAAEEE